jgi:hypothetical protein
MNATTGFTATILHDIAVLFRDEFEGQFRSVYEDATEAAEAAPREAESEVFNAFEHLSMACKIAEQVDASSGDPATVELAKREAYKNFSQAKRHLKAGRFFCIEHQIIATMNRIPEVVGALSDEELALKSSFQDRCDSLEAELRAAKEIKFDPIEDPAELERAVEEFETNIDVMTQLLTEFYDLAEDIAGATEA